MQLSRIPKTSDHYGRYYTDSDIASLLVQSMSVSHPKVAIDLGAGNGALVGEAHKHWIDTQFITVDIDHKAESSAFQTRYGAMFRHHTVDALDSTLAEKIGLGFGKVDLGLCNPPYVHPKWRKHFSEILEDAGLSHNQRFCHNCGQQLVDVSAFNQCLDTPITDVPGLTKWQRAQIAQNLPFFKTIRDYLAKQDPAAELLTVWGFGKQRTARIVDVLNSYVDDFLS
jgi:hypothetical protein